MWAEIENDGTRLLKMFLFRYKMPMERCCIVAKRVIIYRREM